MPTADGRFRGIAVPADAWERVFGNPEPQPSALQVAIRALRKDDESPFARPKVSTGYPLDADEREALRHRGDA